MTKARIGDAESKDWRCRKQGLAMSKARIGDAESKDWRCRKLGGSENKLWIGLEDSKHRATKIGYFDDQNKLFW